jgi:hypothetical protein
MRKRILFMVGIAIGITSLLVMGPTMSTMHIFNDAVFKIYDNNDASKQVALQVSGVTTSTTRTLTVPDTSSTILTSDGYTALAGAWNMGSQNLTNVDIDSGTIDGATLGTNSDITEAQIDYTNINGINITSSSLTSFNLICSNANAEIILAPNNDLVNYFEFKVDGGDCTLTTVSSDFYLIPAGGEVWLTGQLISDSTGGCSVYLSANQSIATGTWTKILFDGESYDTRGEYDSSVNYRYTANTAGNYQVNLGVLMSAPVDTKYLIVSIYKNGSYYAKGRLIQYGTNGAVCFCSDIVPLASSDYIEGWVWHDCGVNKNVYGNATRGGGYTYMSINRMP